MTHEQQLFFKPGSQVYLYFSLLLKMNMDLNHLESIFPSLVESGILLSSLAVIFVFWNHSCLDTSLLRLLKCHLPRCRNFCLVLTALVMMNNNLMKNFALTMDSCRIAVVALVVQISFWLQSKPVSNKCIGTQNIQIVDKSVGGSPVTHRDQASSASTCCRVGVPRYLLSPSSSSGPQSAVNIEEELRKPYVEAFRYLNDEKDVTNKDLVTAIQYLDTLNGGIEVHRGAANLNDAVDHIQWMRQKSRLDDSGLPREYSYEELRDIVVEGNGYSLEDFERVLEKCLENNGFLPSPKEFVEFHDDMKVQLEREVAEKSREVAETKREVAEKSREVAETKREVEEKNREVEETTQEVVKTRHKNKSLREMLQQKDQMLQQHREALKLERRRVREMERNPEGELQRRLRDLEEENRRLSAQSDRSVCKICRVEEVQVSFIPCNHLVSCRDCVNNLTEKVCPLCRQTIQKTVTVLLS
ncbi:uncharacterized protein LOC125678274 isoform X2 [Ostrea edulis]|uniref:uncharacterized protein LOC125678274 isoform X2 n=1 Tax=Ostrea edulis TaxID=37623 RepID=UPI0024AF9B30|nr:uncharacterized protein LOC125678274 isoform X2 [Ostrea edulis]